jgi:uncharacterized coiled-coil protein SlyX
MATLTLKNVPVELVDRLKREAQESRRSLNQETLARLEQSLAIRWLTAEEKVERMRRAQARFADLEPLTDKFLARARNDGRP